MAILFLDARKRALIRPAALWRAAATLALIATVARADPVAPVPDSKPTPEMELHGIEDTLKASEDQRRKVEADIELQRADRARLNAALIETTAKVQDAERGLDAATRKLAELTADEAAQRQSLAKRRDLIADVLAAAQRFGRSRPPAILVEPHDMAKAIREAMLMGAILPDLQDQTKALAADLSRLADLRTSIASQRDSLAVQADALAADRARLTGLISSRQQALAAAEQSLGAERARASDLAKQAYSLKELIARMDHDAGAAKAVADADQAAASEVRAKAALIDRKEPAKLRPMLAFADARGQLPLPAAGAVLKTFGAPDGFGGAEKGVSIATPPGATVASPADGSVLFAGPYRSYGQLLIISVGGGYYVVLAGMDRISVSVGQFVLAGEPVGSMGDGSARTATAAAIGSAQPVLYIEFRKDGAAVDPGPWWSKPDMEKARG
jgi:septal ring factor EnvC (AmiA/AmiB activator)